MPGMMTELLRVAHEITNWAERERMMGSYDVAPDCDDALIQSVFGRAGIQATKRALQDRRISYIGVNDVDNQVVVHLSRPLRAADHKLFNNCGTANVSVIFLHSDLAATGKVPPAPTAQPFELVNGFYTCGSSIYVANHRGAGTFGCLLQDSTGQMYGLSNNHVVAGMNYAEHGIPINAPGTLDIAANSLDPFVIGHLERAVPILDGLPSTVPTDGNVDAAIFKIKNDGLVSSMQRSHYDTPGSSIPLAPNMMVEKVGRTTGRTRGKVVAYYPSPQCVNATVDAISSRKAIFFPDVWGIQGDATAFSAGGDSGSLITTVDNQGNRQAVALLFAATEDLTFAIPLNKILDYFGMTLVSGHNI